MFNCRVVKRKQPSIDKSVCRPTCSHGLPKIYAAVDCHICLSLFWVDSAFYPPWDGALRSNNNKWRWWMWISASPSRLAWSVGWQPPGVQSAFIKWTGWTLTMTRSHDDSTMNIVVVIIIIIGPIPLGHSGPFCHALSLSLSSLSMSMSWTSMRRRRATVPLATSAEWACYYYCYFRTQSWYSFSILLGLSWPMCDLVNMK